MRPLLGIKFEEGKLTRAVMGERPLQLHGQLTGLIRQRPHRNDPAGMAIPRPHLPQQRVEGPDSTDPADQPDRYPNRGHGPYLRQQAEPVPPPRQIDERRQPVDQPKTAITHQRQQAHYHQRDQ